MSKKSEAKKSVVSKPPAAPKKGTAPLKKGNSLKSDSNSKNSKEVKPAPQVPQTSVISPEELKRHASASIIRRCFLCYKARQKLIELKKEKQELNEKLEKLEQEAYIQMVKWEQEREHQKRMKQLKERQILQRRAQNRKKFLEAAYDGNLEEMKHLIKQYENELDASGVENDGEKMDDAAKKKALYELIDCRDPSNNSSLSEAAIGGNGDVVKFLLSNNANPNSKGAFGRTPIWRAAFQGHLSVVQILLENGADPRPYSDDGQSPLDCATQPGVVDLLKNWNIELTERMLSQIEKTRQAMKQEQINGLESRKKEAQKQFELSTSEYEHVKIELYKCNCELQRLHDEYDLNREMYAALIDKKEEEKIELTIKFEKLREENVKNRITFKELLNSFKKQKRQLKKSKNGLDAGIDGDNEEDDENDSKKHDSDSDEDEELNEDNFMKINIKELDEIILRDLSNAVKNNKTKWPLLLDSNDVASTFLRYRDTNYMNCLDVQGMKPERLRKALIGAIRYGKPLVIDVMQYDQELLQSLKMVFDEIDPNLFVDLTNKSIMEKEGYLRLVKLDVDGKEYEVQNFSEFRVKNFKVIFLTSNPYPCEELIRLTMPVKIITTSNKPVDELDLFF